MSQRRQVVARAAVAVVLAEAGAAYYAAPTAHADVGGQGTDAYEWAFYRSSDQVNGLLALFEHSTFSFIYNATAGSGTAGYDECKKSTASSPPGGPIPAGSYDVTAHYLNHTGTVTGPAIQLSDHLCYDGKTLRTELFMHSSYPWSSSHYHSEGCIKVSNTGGPSPASGDVMAMYNVHNFVGYPNHAGVGDM